MYKNILSIVLSSFLLFSGFIFQSCDKDDSEEKRADELRLLEQYITNENITVSPTSTGLYYIEQVEGTGGLPQQTDWVEISFTVRLVKNNEVVITTDSLTAQNNSIYNQYVLYGINRIPISGINVGGLIEGISKMKQGGKARLIFPSTLGFGSISNGNIPGYSSLIFDVELHSVIPNIVTFEQEKLADYLTENNITDPPTISGLIYHEIQAGTGDFPITGKKIYYNYTGYFLNGKVFDKNITGTTYIILGAENNLSGIDEGLRLMKQGGIAKLVLPYSIAYGASGIFRFVNNQYYIAVWPYSTIVYEIEVLDIE